MVPVEGLQWKMEDVAIQPELLDYSVYYWVPCTVARDECNSRRDRPVGFYTAVAVETIRTLFTAPPDYLFLLQLNSC